MSRLIADGVGVRFGDQWILEDVRLALQPGRLTLVAGRSGSGKSTLFSVLAGLSKPTTGRVLYGGRDLAAMGEEERDEFRLRHLGVVFQDFRLLPDLTVLENVRLPMELARRSRTGAERRSASKAHLGRRATAILEDLGLAFLAHRFPETLSGGEQQRVAVARALANDAKVILADEPTANLDEENAHAVMGMLREAAQNGRVVWVTAHDPLVMGYADEVHALQKGVLVRGVLSPRTGPGKEPGEPSAAAQGAT